MKKILLMLMCSVVSQFLMAQTPQQQKIDSVCQLVKQYFNQKDANALYELTGNSFRQKISAADFKAVCENNLFPLGAIKSVHFENNDNGISTYKVTFSTALLNLYISLDEEDKIDNFLFKPYLEKRAKKDTAVASDNPLKSPLDKAIDTAVQPYMQIKATAGLSIGILKDGKERFYNYGETARANHILPNKHTIFEIGSITKTFTATLLAEAVAEGKVQLDDPLNKYLPDSIPPLAFEGQPITLKTLANHTSGLPRLPANFDFHSDNPYKNYNVDDLFSFLKHYKLARKPGRQFEYSNLAVGLLGTILTRVYDKDYETLCIDKICRPLKMNSTRQFLLKSDSAHFAKGYNAEGEYNSQWDSDALAGAGALRSTAADMLKYAEANMGKAPGELRKAMQLAHQVTFSDNQFKIGLVWLHLNLAGSEVLFHNGETGGYHAYLAIDKKNNNAVVILSNNTLSVDDAGNNIMSWLVAH